MFISLMNIEDNLSPWYYSFFQIILIAFMPLLIGSITTTYVTDGEGG